jgi:hypothetical protein
MKNHRYAIIQFAFPLLLWRKLSNSLVGHHYTIAFEDYSYYFISGKAFIAD